MESLGDFLCGIFMTMYWIFRIIVAALAYLEIDFMFTPIDLNTEILLLFVTLVCIVCVFKRKAIGAVIYFVTYSVYYGPDIFMRLKEGIQPETAIYVAVEFIAIILSAIVMINVLISKSKKVTAKYDTDWYYNGEQYDRQLDERADKNNYRIY